MARQPLGKTLLRNVIRHTDAHNKIQEEMEMWKMRDWEVHTSHHKPPDGVRRPLHCERVPDLSRGSRERVSEHDDRDARDARYYSRKLYEFEAKDPDRWGHSGFKELYPEEFESDSEKSGKKLERRKAKSKSDGEGKKAKKSSRKKKKKKKKKKKEESSSGSSSEDEDDKHKTKSRHKDKKAGRSRDEDEERARKRRRREESKDSEARKRRRKDWRGGGESDRETSGD